MENKVFAKQLGAVIRRLRHEIGMSQEAFAVRCRVHRTYMGSIERGEKAITVETANKIAHALGISLSQLFVHLEAGERAQE